MEVSKGQSQITHAVISAEVATSFSLADNSALMDLLSTSVYKNQLLAAIREPLANAWDAHIDANITDTPIQVTIDDTHITIRDFGKGIPDNRMFQVYTVYGLSLKTQDEKATGGFGVGSKAPFAYSDLFEVITRNNGTQSLYIFSKSSAQNDGKPSGVKVYSIPTTEQGLEVRIPYKSQDFHTIKDYFKYLAYYGEILVNFKIADNESLLEIMKYSEEVPYSLPTVYANTPILSSSRNPIAIRYGALVYPLEDNPFYNQEFLTLKRLLERTLHIRGQAFIIKAEPNTLAVAFSRETLAYKSSTLATVRDLLTKAIQYLSTTYENLSDLLDKSIQEETHKFLKELDDPKKEADYFPSWPLTLRVDSEEFNDVMMEILHQKYQTLTNEDSTSVLAKKICEACFNRLPLDKVFYSEIMPKMLRNLPKAFRANPYIGNLFAKHISKDRPNKYSPGFTNSKNIEAVYKGVVKHFHKIVMQSPLLNIHNFYTLRPNTYWLYHLSSYAKKIIYKNSLDGNALYPISYDKFHPMLLTKLLEGIVKINVISASHDINNMDSLHVGRKRNEFFYRISSTKLVDKIAEVQAFEDAVKALKFPFEVEVKVLVDLTPKEKIVRPRKQTEPLKPTSTKKPVAKRAYPQMLAGADGSFVKWTDPNLPTVQSPEYVYYQVDKHGSLQFLTSIHSTLGVFAKEILAKAFGANTAVINNKATYNALVNKGAKPLTHSIFRDVLYDAIIQNDDFIKAVAYRRFYINHNRNNIDLEDLLELCEVPEIKSITGDLSAFKQASYDDIQNQYLELNFFTTKQLDAINEKADAFIKKSKDCRVIEKLLANKYLSYVDTRKSRMTPSFAPEQIKLIKTVLKFRG